MAQFASYRQFCVLQTGILQTGLQNSKSLKIDQKFVGSISEVNIDNCAKFCQVTTPRRYISKNELFERFWTLQTHNLQTR